TVHTHLNVCQESSRQMCGSASVRVDRAPRNLEMRLRYRPETPLAVDAPLNVNRILRTSASADRSLTVYGVFDETNRTIQWRSRHRFPTLRNEEVQGFGLRRDFRVTPETHGAVDESVFETNAYGYAFGQVCEGTALAEGGTLNTDERAVFGEAFGPAIAASPVVCGSSEVTDALGTFIAPALARKNPEVAPAFPLLRSPIQSTAQIGTLLTFCERAISTRHESMQVQRLRLEDAPTFCLDGWRDPGFLVELVDFWSDRIEVVRAQGLDMVLTVALHHDDTTGAVADTIEDALEAILAPESLEGTPRTLGAFVLDSFTHEVRNSLRRLVLWCPTDNEDDEATGACFAFAPTPVSLGPFTLGALPILPTRSAYLSFVDQFSEDQAGRVQSLRFRAPVLTPLSENVPVDDFAVITFFNEERVGAADAFSVCPSPNTATIAYRITGQPDSLNLLSELPSQHLADPQPSYDLGLGWDFPFLTQLDYRVVLAAEASAFSISVPFGFGSNETATFGSAVWERSEFPLGDDFLACTRFCDHPTFDASEVYSVTVPFSPDFADRCYRPSFPSPGDGGFPNDP
ncbi:MAG: hypothetical protein AAF658_10025, partial [Myxococcota bacterium]